MTVPGRPTLRTMPETASPTGRHGSSGVPAAVQADRAVGAVVASAAGDALGAGYEFGPPLAAGAPVRMDGGGLGWEPGEWTDDTQMAVAVLLPLAQAARDPLSEIEAGFRAWFDSGPRDVGNQTSAVLRQPGGLADAAAAFTAGQPDHASGNGSLMRTGPVALSQPGDSASIASLARGVSELTHPDSDCVDACVLWSVAIDHAIHHAPGPHDHFDWAGALRLGLAHVGDDRRDLWVHRIEEATNGHPQDFPNNGWVVHAFQAALAAICMTPLPTGPSPCRHLRSALEEAVRAGNDTDTVAAIAGSLLGARWGATALPFEWRRRIHGRRAYDEPAIVVADLERHARLAFRRGQSDSNGWPATRSMMGHYRSEWPDKPRRVELGGVEFGNVHALDAALADADDVVISLCRMGTDDIPADVEHHVLGLLDSTAEQNPNAAFLLADVADVLRDLVADGRRVFVHCVQAENRTPAIAAAWLHRHHGMTADAALDATDAALNRPKPFLADAVTRSGFPR